MTDAYNDPTVAVDRRVAVLLAAMTIEEKAAQLGAVWFNDLVVDDAIDEDRLAARLPDGIGHVTRIGSNTGLRPAESAEVTNRIQRYAVEQTRLGIPIVVHEESVGGYCARDATVFPQALGLGATWDPALVAEVGDAIRAQLLAVGARHTLAPVLDVARDPRWGRVEETYGESPELAGVLGTAYVAAVQTDDLAYGVVCTGKHFLGYGMSVGGRNHAPVQMGPRELREVYAEPFAAAIRDAGLASVMNSYSAIDGVPCASSHAILTGLLRDELGFDGTVVADYWAVSQLERAQHATAADTGESAVQAVSAGLDLELPALAAYSHIPELVAGGRLAIDVVDRAVERMLTQKFRLGLFENPYVESDAATAAFGGAGQTALARRAAAESVIVLADRSGLLPLEPSSLGAVAVIGPTADDRRLLQGDYHYPAHQDILVGQTAAMLPASGASFAPGPHYTEHVTPLAGLRAALGPTVGVEHARGCHVSDREDADLDAAAELAGRCDLAVVCVGGRSGLTRESTVGEANDAADLDLTGAQTDLVRAVAATGTPFVVVVISGRVHTLAELADLAGALVWMVPPGEQGGHGLADVLVGAVDASGRLPVTVPRHVGQVPIHHDQRSRADRSEFHGDYTDVAVEPLFPFGHGLSYGAFDWDELEIGSGTTVDPVHVSITVTNTSDRAGTAVPQLYVRDVIASTVRPLRQLLGFARVALAPGAGATVRWTVHPSKLALLDPDMQWVTEPGEFTLTVGTSATTDVASASVNLTGDAAPTRQRDIVATEVSFDPA